MSSQTKKNLKICSINVNHLRPRLQEILNYITDHEIDILFLQETLLKPDDHLDIPGYVCTRRDIDQTKRTGGVCTLIKNNIDFSISTEFDKLNKHLQAIKVKLDGVGEVAFINYYQLISEDLPKELFEIATLKFKRFVILGDLNSSNTLFGCSYTSKRGSDLFEYLHDFDLSLLNNEEPTVIHRANNTPNILDLFITNFSFRHNFHVGDDVGSDHFPIHLDISNAALGSSINLSRNLKKTDWNLFRRLISESVEQEKIKTPINVETIDSNLLILESEIIEKLDIVSPKKANKQKTWWTFTPEIKNKVKERRRIKRLAKVHKTPEIKKEYNRINKEVKNMISNQKHQNWKEMAENLSVKTPTLAWRTINKIMSSKTNPEVGIKAIKDEEGNSALNDHEKSKLMAKHLNNKQSLPTDPRFNQHLKEEIIESQKNQPEINNLDDNHNLNQNVTVTELLNHLKKCKNKSAAGEDEINYLIIKNLPYNVLELIANTFTLCIKLGYFPINYRKAIVIMLPKPKKDKSHVKNYRPVSLLSCLGKLLERVMKGRLLSHLQQENLLNKYQYGFMPGKSTSEHLFHLSQDIHNSFKRTHFTVAIFLDIEGAFDTVFIPGLIHKLNNYNLPGNIVAFISSFLTDRSFCVRVGNSKSETIFPESGTPQGSVLSPLLFNLFTNDIPTPDNKSVNLSQYADDLAVWASGNNAKQIEKILQQYLNKLSKWCNDWFIKINPDKTQVVCFSLKRDKININLKLLDKPLEISDEATFLGVIFDKKLTWSSHASKITSTIWRKTNVLRSLAGRDWGARGDYLVKLYKQWAIPNITYGSLTFANMKKTHYRKMGVIQNTLIRSAYRKPMGTRVEDLLNLANLEPIKDKIISSATNEYNRISSDANLQPTIRIWRFLSKKNKQTHKSPMDAIKHNI